MALLVTDSSRGPPSFLQVPSKPSLSYGDSKTMGGLSPMTPKTPGGDSWRLGTSVSGAFDSPGRVSTPMRCRKAATGPPGWMVSEAAPNSFDTSGTHKRAHIQSLANLDKEVLAEKLFHSKIQVSELLTENVCPRLLCLILTFYLRGLESIIWHLFLNTNSGTDLRKCRFL